MSDHTPTPDATISDATGKGICRIEADGFREDEEMPDSDAETPPAVPVSFPVTRPQRGDKIR